MIFLSRNERIEAVLNDVLPPSALSDEDVTDLIDRVFKAIVHKLNFPPIRKLQ